MQIAAISTKKPRGLNDLCGVSTALKRGVSGDVEGSAIG
jgi:hypothetical protein